VFLIAYSLTCIKVEITVYKMKLQYLRNFTVAHIVRDTAWCVIDIDTSTGRVFLQQRWNYTWVVRPPMALWTPAEKSSFHKKADHSIWNAWSNKAKLKVTGTAKFARTFNGKGLPINLDIRRVTAKHHWLVNVTKVPTGAFVTSSVRWNSRQINLDTNDFATRKFSHSTVPRKTQQVPVAHEFGHAAGNTSVLNRGDEYKSTSPHVNDQGSILHSGNQLRARHFLTILEEMNKMIPNCTFSVLSV
jgi:hypothetical protein